MKMFTTIQELVEDPSVLVIVLIDEVESLARARQSSNSSNEPSDSVRVVNALLTQIDQIKRYSQERSVILGPICVQGLIFIFGIV